MKTQKNNIILFTIAVLLNLGCYAQNSIIGTIENYTIGEGVLSSYDIISREKVEIGKIDKDGNFNIPLDANYLSVIKEQAEKAKDKAPKGWEINFNTVATTFECFGGELIYNNGEAIITGIPYPEVAGKSGNELSVLYAVSDPEIAKWLYSYGQKNIVKGYYLQWFFIEDSASAKGECIFQRYTGNDDENFNEVTITDLEFQKGWNIIKYTITDVFTDLNGNTLPSKTVITNITKLPNDLKWIKIVDE
jgi:hypothetical protein